MNKTSILIVEDEIIIAADLENKLKQIGYDVAGIASQGAEAVEMARYRRPSLILMDIRLDGPMDGIETADTIRRRYDIPVIFLTAHSDRTTLSRAKLAAPFGYILKPFEDRELVTQIELALYKHDTERQAQKQRELLKAALAEKEAIIAELKEAVDKVHTLSGLLPICSSCKNIRDDKGYWNQIEAYIQAHSKAEFTHSICPDCAKKLYPGIKITENRARYGFK